MSEMEFIFSGRQTDVEKVLLELGQLPEVVSISSIELPQTPSILRRGTQHQFELYEASVSFVINLASAAAYEGTKALIAALAKKRDVRVDEKSEKDGNVK